VTVLVIRAHKRYAVRQAASLAPGQSRRGPGAKPHSGLLIELSLEGCRLGQIDDSQFATGQDVTLHVPGFKPRTAQVRWSHGNCVGLRFEAPLHVAELDSLVRACRLDTPPAPADRAYGT